MTDVRALDVDLALMSEAVYERPWTAVVSFMEAEDGRARHGRWSLVQEFDHAGSQAALFHDVDGERDWAIVFRGTEAQRKHVRDIAANAGYPTGWAGPGLAHSGYASYLARVGDRARRFADRVPNDARLHVTGQSMGGAIATLYSAWVLTAADENAHRIFSVSTYGSPKPLSGTGCRALRAAAQRRGTQIRQFVIPMDFAPYWPPSITFQNPGPEVRLPSPTWWPGPVTRHAPRMYVRAAAAAYDAGR